jgi:hypothetical protein
LKTIRPFACQIKELCHLAVFYAVIWKFTIGIEANLLDPDLYSVKLIVPFVTAGGIKKLI